MMQEPETTEGVALSLGRFVSDTRWRDVADTLKHDAKRSLINFFGCALGVARDPEFDGLVAVLDAFSGPREVTVIGRAERMDALSASTLNAVSANLLDYDDTHLDTVEATVEQARGSIEKPLSDTELEAKVYELAARRLPAADIAQLLDCLWQLHDMATIHPLMALVSGPD